MGGLFHLAVSVLVLASPLFISECAAQLFGPKSDPLMPAYNIPCPVEKAMPKFEMDKFMGDWYVLEYQYTSEMRLKDLSCVGFHFSQTGFGDIISNFTFRFPPHNGHFYHVPTFSTVSQIDNAIWETQFKGVDLLSAILDTDYSRWAVLAQCSRPTGAKSEPKFFSTRIMSRSRSLGAADLARIQAAIQEGNVGAPFKYPVEQGVCQEIDGV